MKNFKGIIAIGLALALTVTPVMQTFASDVSGLSGGEVVTDTTSVDTASTVSKVTDYAYVESPVLAPGELQNVAVSLLDKSLVIEAATMQYNCDGSTDTLTTDLVQSTDGVMLFTPDTSVAGTYTVTGITYMVAQVTYTVDFATEGIEAQYVVQEGGTTAIAPADMTVQVIADDGTVTTADSLQQGLAMTTLAAASTTNTLSSTTPNNNIVVVLDPGHDIAHKGAHNDITGVFEEDYNLIIAKACRAELREYEGVDVYMTRPDDGSCPYPETTSVQCNYNRVQYAKSVGADIYVSIHLNQVANNTLTTANGAEVFVSNYSNYTSSSTNLANQILVELGKLGLSNRGVKIDAGDDPTLVYDDGSLQDDYSVIRNSVLNGFPGMIVEHAFIDNTNDAALITSKAAEMGKADATAIAKYYGLSKDFQFSITPRGEGSAWDTIALKVNTQYVDSGYTNYQFKYCNISGDGIWHLIGNSGTATSVNWSPPGTGVYMIALNATNSNNIKKVYASKSYYNVNDFQVNDITAVPINNGTQVTMTCNSNATNPNLQYSFLKYDVEAKTWAEIAPASTSNTVTWTPGKCGDYWLHVYVTNANVSEPYGFTDSGCYTVEKGNAYINSFTADLKTPQLAGKKITLSASYSVVPDDPEKYCQFLVYDGVNWKDITTSSKTGTTWTPTKSGNYLLCYQVITSTGKAVQQFIQYAVTEPTTTISGITVDTSQGAAGIGLTANVETNDSHLQYTFKVYDGIAWARIGTTSENNTAVWKPTKSGNFLLYVETTGTTGKISSYIMNYSLSNTIAITNFKTDLASPQKAGQEIILDASVSAVFAQDLTYQYLVYNGSYWSNVSTSGALGTAKWTPTTPGTYLVCFQVIEKSGKATQSFLSYTIKEPMVKIDGITVGTRNSSGEIPLTAKVTTNETNLTYTFKVYDGTTWSKVGLTSTNSSTVWKPVAAGNYYLYVEVKDTTGKVYPYIMEYNLANTVSITGFATNVQSPQKINKEINLSAAVSATYPTGLTYNYLVYNGSYWSNLSLSQTLGTTTWKPTKTGSYLLCFQVIEKSGKVTQSFINYNITEPVVQLNGIKVGTINNAREMMLKADVITTETNLNYTFKAYDGTTWSKVGITSTSSEMLWSPAKEGPYLLYVEVTDENGKSYSSFLPYELKPSILITSFNSDKASPQKEGQNITLSASVSTPTTKNLTYQFLAYNGTGWSMISSSTSLGSVVWQPTVAGSYLVCFQVVTDSGRAIQQFMNYSVTPYYHIMGTTSYTASQMVSLYASNNSFYPATLMSAGGAPTIISFCQMYIDEANAEGVKAEVAFCQAMLETGFLKYGGDVKPEQYNFAGLGATGGGVGGASFPDVRTGIRAQIQHLKLYASTEPLASTCVDPRPYEYLRGKAPYIEWLSIPNNPYGTGWAADANYSAKIQNLIGLLSNY